MSQDRVPPHSLDAERGILGGMLLVNDLIDTVVDLVKADDFYSDTNGEFFEAMLNLRVDSTVDRCRHCASPRGGASYAPRGALSGGVDPEMGIRQATVPGTCRYPGMMPRKLRWTTHMLRDGRLVLELVPCSTTVAAVAMEIFPGAGHARTYALIAIGAERVVVRWQRAGEA